MRKEFRSSVGKDLNGNPVYNSVERRQSLKGSSWKERRGVYDKKTGVYTETEDSGGTSYGGIFKLIIVVLLAIALFRVLMGFSSDSISFKSFFEMLVQSPTVNLTNLLDFKEVAFNLPDWLSWLNGTINFFLSLVNVVGFIVLGLIQCVLYIVHFLKWLFVV